LAAIQASTPLKQRVSSSNFSIFCIFLRRWDRMVWCSVFWCLRLPSQPFTCWN
jgi:hypothetical protein